jgi:uncharacterized protein YjbJ (UPF0337 family)
VNGTAAFARRYLRDGDVKQKDFDMNKNQIDGGMKEAAGKVQKEFGKVVDSPKHKAEGGMKEASGKVQKTAGNIEEKARNIGKEAAKPV